MGRKRTQAQKTKLEKGEALPQKKEVALKKARLQKSKTTGGLKGGASINAQRAHGAYQVILRPHISEKSVAAADAGKYVFEVYNGVNAHTVRRAIERMYGVEVTNIHMLKVPNKRKNFRRLKGKTVRHNKAIVTLKSGNTIEVLPQ